MRPCVKSRDTERFKLYHLYHLHCSGRGDSEMRRRGHTRTLWISGAFSSMPFDGIAQAFQSLLAVGTVGFRV